jgi:hypothetical protein
LDNLNEWVALFFILISRLDVKAASNNYERLEYPSLIEAKAK